MITRFDRIHERDRQTPRDGMLPAALMHSIARQTYNTVWRVERGPQFRCTRQLLASMNGEPSEWRIFGMRDLNQITKALF